MESPVVCCRCNTWKNIIKDEATYHDMWKKVKQFLLFHSEVLKNEVSTGLSYYITWNEKIISKH